MASMERGAATAPARIPEMNNDIESLPSLFGRLGDDVMKLLDTKLSLLKVEIKEDADAYVRATDPALEAQTFANEQGVLLAPDLDAVVSRAVQLYAQVGDAAAKQLTQPKATATPAPSPSPTARP